MSAMHRAHACAKLAFAIAACACVLLLRTSPAMATYKLEDLVEMKCLNPAPPMTSTLDPEWMMSVDTWYYVHMSQYDMYHSMADVMEVPVHEVKDEDVYYKSCWKFLWGAKNPEPKLFVLGKQVPVEWKPNANGTFMWKIGNAPAGLATIALTDNKSYIFAYACWISGHASWGVIANAKELSQEAVNEIHEYAKSIGFLEKHFMHVRYDTCEGLDSLGVEGDGDGDGETKKKQQKKDKKEKKDKKGQKKVKSEL